MFIKFTNKSSVVTYVALKVEAKKSVCDTSDRGYSKFCFNPAVITSTDYEVRKVGTGTDY